MSKKADSTSLSNYALKSDLESSGVKVGGINFYTVENNSAQATTKKIAAKDNAHLTGILIVDYNGHAGIFAAGKVGGVKTIIGVSKFDVPTVSNNVLSIPLSAWGAATLMCYGDATII